MIITEGEHMATIIRRKKGEEQHRLEFDLKKLQAVNRIHDNENFQKFSKLVYLGFSGINIQEIFDDVMNEPHYGSWVSITRNRENITYDDIQQRISIRAGKIYETALNNFLSPFNLDPLDKIEIESKLSHYDINGKIKNIQVDSLYIVGNIFLISAEYKMNVSLDSGKSSDTKIRADSIERVLKEHRRNVFSIIVCLSCPIQKLLTKMPTILKPITYGYQEFLSAFGIYFDENHWNGLIIDCDNIVKEKFNTMVKNQGDTFRKLYEK